MRSLIEKQKDSDGNKQGKWLLIFMLLILVISSVGYAFLSNPGSNTNQNTDPNVQNPGEPSMVYNGQPLYMSYSQSSVSKIPVDTKFNIGSYYHKEVYLAGDNAPLLNAETLNNIGLYTDRLQQACLGSCDSDLPEKTCNDLVIYWNSSIKEKKVYQKDNCVYVEGDLQAVDAFLYSLFK